MKIVSGIYGRRPSSYSDCQCKQVFLLMIGVILHDWSLLVVVESWLLHGKVWWFIYLCCIVVCPLYDFCDGDRMGCYLSWLNMSLWPLKLVILQDLQVGCCSSLDHFIWVFESLLVRPCHAKDPSGRYLCRWWWAWSIFVVYG